MNFKTARTSCLLMIAAGLLALAASLIGLVDASLYKAVVDAGNITEFLRIGSLAQDIITIPMSMLLLVLTAMFLQKRSIKVYITMLGLTGFLFYGYALYAMQAQYTSIYILYLAIFGLTIYALVYGLSSFDATLLHNVSLKNSTRIAIAIFLTSVVVVLTPVWLMMLLPTIASHKPADTYGVFVLDLAVVFPALGIVTVMLLRKKAYGNVFAGVVLFKAFTVCLSVAFGEWFVAHEQRTTPNVGNMGMFGTLTAVSGVLFAMYLRDLKIHNDS